MSDRFHVTYLLTLAPGEDAEERIRALQLEQSAELPDPVVHSLGMQYVTGSVTELNVMGEPESAGDPNTSRYAGTSGKQGSSHLSEAAASGASAGPGVWPRQLRVTIAWPKNNHGNEITQLLNVLFGNISMKRGIAITDIRWEDVAGDETAGGGRNAGGERDLVAAGRNRLLAGPAFGIQQIRKKWNIHGRALACTALKPMGYSSRKLADLAFRFALGGVDIIKDDHGLADQPTAPFTERVEMCVEAVDRAAQKTGCRSRYFPNITTDPHRVTERFEQAAELGADGVLLCPMLVGPALMHHLARLNTGLPIMAHPAFSGSYVAQAGTPSTHTAPHGFEPGLFYGGLMRALGADFTIYPNTGGRFSFTSEVCDAINSHARNSGMPFAPCFPAPGGGMQRDRMAFWLKNYGADTTFLMGGSLFEDPAGIEAASRAFMETLGA
ncbi:MAG: ribulose 1,5-bisphosphate carboxylase large subunit [Balneolaceae bacterium]|nr:MAG: ribulose 1,5-bisphosphate carboxylase large subunit [Balneolaceae bacterium]